MQAADGSENGLLIGGSKPVLARRPNRVAASHAGPSRSNVPRIATTARIFMKLYRICSVSALALTVLASAGTALADPRGLWLAQDGARVRVSSCGKGLCAIIASTKSRIDPATGASWTDKNNPDPGKRNRPLVGVEVLGSLTQDGSGKWLGWLYNTDNGQTYRGHLIEIDHKTIRVEGCAIGICGGQNMSRIE